MVETTVNHLEKGKNRSYFILYTEIDAKRVRDLNVKQ